MAYIYIIKNDINDKVYIGKTNFSIEKRWKEHLEDATKKRINHRPLYYAINKYGKEHFYISQIEQCTVEESADREKYWINFYNSYHNGYNATKGGDGKTYLNYKKILKLIDETNLSQKEIANICNCCVDSVGNIAHIYRNEINWHQRNKNHKSLLAQPKKVECLETKTIFNSTLEAGNWLVKINKTKSNSCRTHISAVCKGKRKTAYGYHWRYV